MLSMMRKKAGSWMLKVILGVIAVVFVFWGFGPQRSKNVTKVASVNGEIITKEEYDKQYNDMVEEFRRSLGENFNEGILKDFQPEKQVLDSIIERRLMLSEAEKLNFRVTDEELNLNILRMSAFQTGGQFNQNKYLQVLRYAGLTPEAFREMQREALAIEKLRLFITESVKVSEMEAEEWYNWKNAEVNIDVVKFSPDTYKSIEVFTEDVRSFYEKNNADYKTEPKIKVQFVRFNPADYRSKIKITDEEIQEYYEANPEQFETPKTVEARHILIKVDSNASEEEVQTAKKRAMTILNMAKSGEEFAGLAQQYSEGPSKSKGGYLGEFQRQQMVKPFADKAFSMKKGEISEPVRTQFGWHIIKVEGINEAKVVPEQEAKKEIQKKIKEDRARTMAYDDADDFYDFCLNMEELQKAADEKMLPVVTTEFFSRTSSLKGIRSPDKFKSVAFELMESEISDIHDLGDGYYILQVMEKLEARIPDLKEVKERVRSDLIREKRRQRAMEDARTFLEALKNGAALETESKRYHVRSIQTGFFKRSDEIPVIGYEKDISKAAFELVKGNPLPNDILQGTNGYYVIRFKDRHMPSIAGFSAKKDDIIKELLEQKKMNTFDNWLSQVKRDSDIEIEETFQNKL